MLVYTPKGNIPVVGNYLQQCSLLLDHPTPPHDPQKVANYYYYNPHNPPPGGHNRAVMANNRMGYGPAAGMKWGPPALAGKSVEVQRSQVDELFKSLKDGEELAETEPSMRSAHQTTQLTHSSNTQHLMLRRGSTLTKRKP